jgi:hypothetical protein
MVCVTELLNRLQTDVMMEAAGMKKRRRRNCNRKNCRYIAATLIRLSLLVGIRPTASEV